MLSSPSGLLRAINTDSKVLIHKNIEFTTYNPNSRQMLWIENDARLFSARNLSQPIFWYTYWLKLSYFSYWVVGYPVVKDVVGDLEEYSENVGYLKWATTSSLKRCRWFQQLTMLIHCWTIDKFQQNATFRDWRSRGVFIKYREHSMDSQRRLFGRNTTPLN